MSSTDYLNALSGQSASQHQQIQAWGETLQKTPERRSQSIAKLIEALAKAQLEFDPVKKENSNPFFKSKYADLATVLGATQKHLAKYGLVVVQEPIVNGAKAGVRTVLAHSSGEWWDMGELLLPLGKQDAQGAGSALTYSRRYAYQSAVGVSAEEDDDGNAAVSNGKSHKDYEEAYENKGAPGRIKQFQVNAFLTTCAENGKTEKQISAWLKTLGKIQAEELTPEEFQKGLKWAHGKEELTQTITNSVKAVKGKKSEPQGVALEWEKTEITDADVSF